MSVSQRSGSVFTSGQSLEARFQRLSLFNMAGCADQFEDEFVIPTRFFQLAAH